MEEMISALQIGMYFILALMLLMVTVFIVIMGKPENRGSYNKSQQSKENWQTSDKNYNVKNNDDGPIRNL